MTIPRLADNEDLKTIPPPSGGRTSVQRDLATIPQEVRDRLKLTQSEDSWKGYVSYRHTSSGADVKWWQEQINEFRRSKGLESIAVTGTVDPATTTAIKQMQTELGVVADGVIGPRTFRAFMRNMFNVAKDAVIEVGHAIFEGFKNKFGFEFLSEDEYKKIIRKTYLRGFRNTYIEGLGETFDQYSMSPLTFDGLPPALKESLKNSAVDYKPEDLIAAVNKASAEFKVPPLLVMWIIKKESNFNRNVVSRAGAQGLMQLMPDTARGLGVTDSFDLEQNIRGGTQYLADKYAKYKSIPLALAAYNAGPGNVDKYGGIPPFNETRNYVSVIMGNLQMSASLQDYLKAKGAPSTPEEVMAVARGVFRVNQDRTYAQSGWTGDPSFEGGIDCSDFVSEYLRQIGIKGDWHSCTLFAKEGNLKLMKDIGVFNSSNDVIDSAQPGDVIVWGDHGGRDGHTGYVISEGKIAESTPSRDTNGRSGVQIRPIERFLKSSRGRPIRILRPPQMAA